MVLYALGTGLSLFLLSLLTSETFGTLDEQHTARVFSAVGLIETLGEMSGIPLLSSAWICGIKVGGMGLGLPFYVCSVSHSVPYHILVPNLLTCAITGSLLYCRSGRLESASGLREIFFCFALRYNNGLN